MFEDDDLVPGSAGSGSLHKFRVLQGQHGGADGSGIAGDGAYAQGEGDIGRVGSECRDNGDGQQETRDSHEHIQNTHDHIVRGSGVEARKSSQDDAYYNRNCRGNNTHCQGNPGAEHHAGEDAAAIVIGSEGIGQTGFPQNQGVVIVNGNAIIKGQVRTDGNGQQKHDNKCSQHSHLAPEQALHHVDPCDGHVIISGVAFTQQHQAQQQGKQVSGKSGNDQHHCQGHHGFVRPVPMDMGRNQRQAYGMDQDHHRQHPHPQEV